MGPIECNTLVTGTPYPLDPLVYSKQGVGIPRVRSSYDL